jgi:hypothetical protein
MQALVASNPTVVAECFILVKPKVFDTGAIQNIGFWTGHDAVSANPDGTSRTYLGGGALLDVGEPITYSTGLMVKTWQFTLGITSPEVDALIRSYDYRLAEITVWRANYDPSTLALIEYTRMLRGRVQTAPIEQPSGGNASCVVTCSTAAIDLTRNLSHMLTDEFQKGRSGDRFLKYMDVSGTFSTNWQT